MDEPGPTLTGSLGISKLALYVGTITRETL